MNHHGLPSPPQSAKRGASPNHAESNYKRIKLENVSKAAVFPSPPLSDPAQDINEDTLVNDHLFEATYLPQAVLLIYAAKSLLTSAHSLSPALSASNCCVETLESYRRIVLSALVCLRAVLQLSVADAQQVKPELDLTARLLLVETILQEGQVDKPFAASRVEVENVLRTGLLVSGKDPAFNKYNRALQSAQIRFLLAAGKDSSGEKLAKSQAKRLCLEMSQNLAEDPEWTYHFHFLYHSMSPSPIIFDQIQALSKARGDTELYQAVTLMRLHWAISEQKWQLANRELAILDPLFQARLGQSGAEEKAEGTTEQQKNQIYHRQLRQYFLILKTIYHLNMNKDEKAIDLIKATLREVHVLLDSSTEVDKSEYEGRINIPIREAQSKASLASPITSRYVAKIQPLKSSSTRSITLQIMPRATLYTFVFLLSAVVNRDPLGKEPKGSLFLKGGLSAVDEFLSRGTREGVVYFPLSVVTEERRTVKRIKAELLFYSVELNMMRSKLANATKILDQLVDHAAHEHPELWIDYQLRITLAKAMLYHALDQEESAIRCYAAVLVMSPANCLAQAGIVLVRLARGEKIEADISNSAGKPKFVASGSKGKKMAGTEAERDWSKRPLEDAVLDVVTTCSASEAPRLQIVGSLVAAVTRNGIVKSKHHLSNALLLATATGNSHIKPLILALLGNLFLKTRHDEAQKMFVSAYGMARGMGSTASKQKDKSKPEVIDETMVGHPRLGLWLGERLLGLYKADGKSANAQSKVDKQQAYNQLHREVLSKLQTLLA